MDLGTALKDSFFQQAACVLNLLPLLVGGVELLPSIQTGLQLGITQREALKMLVHKIPQPWVLRPPIKTYKDRARSDFVVKHVQNFSKA